ncbi:glycoside hydrolase family 3 N-terminal domain-containing protein [Sphingomonas rubra]|uniref:beta-glucosidase n=1 Tax=Sphingomonas rubra TaxID=634430 RepID=A0A1I5QYD5_9SPHN|nr:glycoside hydrolase family 3 N-terminal domain-containing protein [Sphingomonas rubra]SFP51265.1 beta-glucosidase [Sphingomonas rubra]
MREARVTRRSVIAAAALGSAWAATPLRAALQAVAGTPLPAAARDALARMTIAEKAGQLSIMAAAWGGNAADALNPTRPSDGFAAQLADVRAGRLTGVFNGNGVEMARQMQTAAVRESRLKVPLIFAADVIHGFRTIFPVPLGEAASFEPDLARRTARAAAVEATAAGIDWTFAPMVDVARDSRWGRTVESSGEDVLLGEIMGAARVRGFQGTRGLTADDAVMSCPKHFAAYGAAESGLDYNSVDLSERTLREVYLAPFKAAFDAGAATTMASFNEIAGIPATANRFLLQQVLRDEWHWRGLVVSDYTGDLEMVDAGYARDARDAARLAFLAGVDMSMQSGLYRDHLPALVAAGEVPIARVDEAVTRVLQLKASLGLFDDPFRRIDARRMKTRVLTPGHRALAREAGVKSIVMLKNDGGLLPLPRSGKRIALIGPFAAGKHDLIGPWNVYGTDEEAIDLATGVRAAMGANATVTVAAGSGIEEPIAGGIEAAVAAARAADLVVLAIGESQVMSGEAQSRLDIVVPPPQQALAEAVAATGKPVVVVLKHGRALALTGAVLEAPAILATWFLGSETGHAIADVLFGRESPSARLPVSFPYASGQEPYHYDHKATGRPNGPGPLQPYKARWREAPNAARFAFGHGLTYGDVAYADLDLGSGTMAWDGALTVRATVTNRGRRACEEVVQLYVRDVVASVTRPIRQLRGFEKVRLAPGARRVVSFTLRRGDLSFIGVDNRPVVEPGRFQLWIAPSGESDGVTGSFELVAA